MLAGWAAAPARFREDANAEDDLALGGYRDRVVVELAQNASDAAGSDGLLRLRLTGDVLSAANTGAPLDAAGVLALSTLRASAKRAAGSVGRFGVGFAAVAAVADEVVVASTTGAVRFDRARTRAEVQAVPALRDELAARGGRVPLLRLPFPATDTPLSTGTPPSADTPPFADTPPAADTPPSTDTPPSADSPPPGIVTEVRLVLRAAAVPLVQDLLADLDPPLLLVLPGLSVLQVQDRELRAEPVDGDVRLAGVRWRVAGASGELDPALLAQRPVEERARTRWDVTWAVPVDEAGVPQPPPGARVLRAPTPTDDPLSLPALLAASLPLGPDRRRVQPGPVTDAVLEQAAALLVELAARLADGPQRLVLVPGPLGAGEVDARLCAAVLRHWRVAPLLAGRRPDRARVLDGASAELVAVLEPVVDLLPAPWAADRWTAPLRTLGVRRLDLAGLTELLAGADRPPGWWRLLYDALPPDRDALGALPVPLADGRLAPGPRGLLVAALPGEQPFPVDLSPLGLRVVHPEAAHPLLLRLGAVQAQPRALLADPRVRAAVEAALDSRDDWADEDDPGAVTGAVLAVVAGAGLRPGELPWLAALPLPDDEGGWRPAGELLLPDGPLAGLVDRDAGFGCVREGVAPGDVLAAVGALRGFAVVPVEDADDVDGLDAWLATLEPGQEPGDVVRDLDLVRDDAWPAALDLLRADDLLRLPYVRWWLATHPVLGGNRPADLRAPGSDPLLTGLYDPAPADAPGVRSSLAEVLADDPDDLLDRLADPKRQLDRAQVRAVHAALAAADPDVAPPTHVRAVLGPELVVLPADDVVVVDRPDLLPRVAPYAVVPVPVELAADLADLLDLALASEVVPAARLGGPGVGGPGVGGPGVGGPGVVEHGVVEHEVVEHDRLVLPTAGGDDVEVVWAVDGGTDHVVGVAGRARALAWRAGRWASRHAVQARLTGAADRGEDDLDPP